MGGTDVACMAVKKVKKKKKKKNHRYSTHLENIYEHIFQNRFNYLHIISFSLPENVCGAHKRHGVPTAGGHPDAGQPAAVSPRECSAGPLRDAGPRATGALPRGGPLVPRPADGVLHAKCDHGVSFICVSVIFVSVALY